MNKTTKEMAIELSQYFEKGNADNMMTLLDNYCNQYKNYLAEDGSLPVNNEYFSNDAHSSKEVDGSNIFTYKDYWESV